VKKAFIAIATDIVEKKASLGDKGSQGGGVDVGNTKPSGKKACSCGS